MPEKVLLATDLSEGSLAAARALPHVAAPDAEVHVVHVVPSPALIGDLTAGERDRIEESLKAPGEASLETDVRAWTARAGLGSVSVRVLRGEPSRALAKEAATLGARLVAMGSHGTGRVERLLLGSVARATLRRASGRDVLVARPAGAWPPRRILLGTDLADAATGAARTSRALAARHGAEVVVAHVVDPSAWNLAYDPRAGPPSSRAVDASVGRLLDAFVAERMTDGARRLVLHGRPAIELAEAASREGADLVVVGSHGARTFERLMLGSVAEGVVERSPASVLVVAAVPGSGGEAPRP